MEDRPIAGAKRAHRGWRRHQLRIAQWPSVFLVPRLRPSKRPPARDQAACGRGRDHHAIRQFVDRQGQWMQALAPVLQPLAMKHLVDPSRIRSLAAIAGGPGGAKASAASRRQKKQGRCPAASAVASSRKNSSVQLRPPITSRRTPLYSQTQTIQAFVAQRRDNSVRVRGSWMMPRLPVNMPRWGMATISPKGVTRFCNGTVCFSLSYDATPAPRAARFAPQGSPGPRPRGSFTTVRSSMPTMRKGRIVSMPMRWLLER